MKFNTSKCKIEMLPTGHYIFKTLIETESVLNPLNKLCNKDCIKVIDVKEFKKGRSLTANSYFWAMLSKLAKHIQVPLGDMYVKVLHSYGLFESLKMATDVEQSFIKRWDTVNSSVDHTESLCVVTKRNEKYSYINAYYGSSTYNTKEFSDLINGVINECTILGIPTITPKELEQLIKNYNGGLNETRNKS